MSLVVVEVVGSLSLRGGAEVFASSLSYELNSRNNVEVAVISLYDHIHETFREKFIKEGIRFFTCGKKRGIDFSAAKTFKKIINSLQPDIIHFHIACLPTYFLAFGLKKRKWSLFETFHSIPGSTVSRLSDYIRKLYIRHNLIRFVGISNEISNLAVKKYKGIVCSTVFNGIKIRDIELKTEKKYDLVNVASFTPVKNQMLLLKALQIIQHFKPTTSLLLVGDGPTKSECELFVKKEKIGNVYFVGQSNDVYPYLSDSLIFVLSSKREGNPISILEAMNCGLPVVAPKVGGIPDIITDGVNGFLYKPEEVNELASTILKLLNDKSLISSISNNCTKKIEEYAIEKTIDEYLILFNEKGCKNE